MHIDAVKKAYRRYASVYDAVFGSILHPARKAVISALECEPGECILEVGVGTGLSLGLYPTDVHVTGIDVSTEMLAKAQRRAERHSLTQVEALLEMDAEAMRFEDRSFDKVVAMYVASVVPNPVRLVAEMRRVCRPGGEIVIVNHFRSKHPFLRFVEDALAPLSRLAGFRPDFDLEEFLDSTHLNVVDMKPANLLGYWKILHCRPEPLLAAETGGARAPVAA
jgi:phosphatidylethanolamine/phosphatidyl-N-methylethanolamine N-methyltransferase